MNPNETSKIYAAVLDHVENNRLKDAFDTLKSWAAALQNWSAAEKISELETNYRYMIHYLVEGKKDPDQQKIYSRLVRGIYLLADDLSEQWQIRNSSALFFEKARIANIRQPLSLNEYRDIICQLVDTSAIIELMPEGEEKKSRLHQNSIKQEETVQDLFYSLFSSPRATDEEVKAYRDFTSHTLIPTSVKCMLISALTMNLLQRFDPKKFDFLLESCYHPESGLHYVPSLG